MTASIWFIVLSVIAIIAPMLWALVQVRVEPARWFRITVPVIIAAVSAVAFFSGRVASNQQSVELERLKPRSVSEVQRAELKKRLPVNFPVVRIVYRLMDGEGKDYSEQLARALREAGGTVASIVGNSLADLPGTVTVAVSQGDAKSQSAADQLCDVLTEIGIKCGGEIAAGQLAGAPSQGEILLVVGRRT